VVDQQGSYTEGRYYSIGERRRRASMSWSMGQVISVQAGDDGIIRVATILVRGKEVSSAVRKLCTLPFESNNP